MTPDQLAEFFHREASWAAAKYGDQESTAKQRQMIARTLKAHIPGDRGDGGKNKGAKDDYYRKFLASMFSNATGASSLLMREASVLISWMFWDGFVPLEDVRAEEPWEMHSMSENEMLIAVGEILRRMNDNAYLEFPSLDRY